MHFFDWEKGSFEDEVEKLNCSDNTFAVISEIKNYGFLWEIFYDSLSLGFDITEFSLSIDDAKSRIHAQLESKGYVHLPSKLQIMI